MEPLELEERVGHEQPATGQPLEPPTRRVDEACERSEVERHLFDSALTKQLDAAGDEELHQAVRRVLLAAHQRKRHGVPAVARHEVEEAADTAIEVAAQHDQAVAVVVPA